MAENKVIAPMRSAVVGVALMVFAFANWSNGHPRWAVACSVVAAFTFLGGRRAAADQ